MVIAGKGGASILATKRIFEQLKNKISLKLKNYHEEHEAREVINGLIIV
jgi:hypothetical protein